MAWNEAVVTNYGLDLLSECILAGGSIEITSAVGGESYSPAVSLMAVKEIAAPNHNLQVAKTEKNKNSVTVNVRVQNNGLAEAYTIRQIGIFARIKDSGSAPVLLALIQDKEGENVPAEEENPEFLLEYDFVIPVDNGENISVSVTPNTFATLEDLSEHINDNIRHITNEERVKWNGKAAGSHTHGAATSTANGFMSAADKAKLDGIAEEANKYTHPATAGNKHIPAGGKSGQILRWSGDGTAVWGADNNTTYSNMSGASASAAGKAGLVPAPAAGAQTKYLRGDGTWQTPPDTNTTYTAATTSKNGLMSAADKEKLDGIEESANNYTHPAYTARTGMPTANQTPAFGSTFSVTQPVSDESGHITAMNTKTVKIPNTAATASAAGLMSAADKIKLNGIATGATKFTVSSAAFSMSQAISAAVPSGSKFALAELKCTLSDKCDYIVDCWRLVMDLSSEYSEISHLNGEAHLQYSSGNGTSWAGAFGKFAYKNGKIAFTIGRTCDDCDNTPENSSNKHSTVLNIYYFSF